MGLAYAAAAEDFACGGSSVDVVIGGGLLSFAFGCWQWYGDRLRLADFFPDVVERGGEGEDGRGLLLHCGLHGQDRSVDLF